VFKCQDPTLLYSLGAGELGRSRVLNLQAGKSDDTYIHSGLMFWNYISIIEKIESLSDSNIDRHQQELAIYIQHQ